MRIGNRYNCGQTTYEVAAVGNVSQILERDFDVLGRLTTNDGSHCHYSPDGQIAVISNTLARVDYAYTADRLDAGYTLTLANGVVLARNLTRDSYRCSLVTTITNAVSGFLVETYSYSYDALCRPTARNSDTFDYNDRSEVTAAKISGGNKVYGYDEIGNSTNWTANALNQYTEFT